MKKVLRALSLALVIAMLAVTAFADSYVPVSYTHLTLPTILLV